MRLASVLAIVAALAFAPACGMKKMATHVIGGVSSDGIVALEGEEDVAFARESALPLIKTLEVLRHGDPKDRTALTLLARAYGQYAFGFLEEEMLTKKGEGLSEARARADLFYRRGKEYGIAALINDGAMEKAFKRPVPDFERAVKKLGKGYVPALFWTAFNWAGYLNLHLDDPQALIDVPRVEAMIARILELDPSYYYGSAHSLKGAMAAFRPKMLGGDPALAKREFEEAMRIAPGYLMTKVMFAQYYAKAAQDAALYRGALEEVVKADASLLKEQRLANELAQRRAKLLIPMASKLF